MSIPPQTVRGISFDYGHVIGGLDLDELERRLEPAPGGGREVRVKAMRGVMSTAFRVHDEVLARGETHPRAWRAFMDTLVSAALPDASAAEISAVVEALWQAQPTRNLWRYTPPEALSLLSELKAAGVPMVVTTNSEGRAREFLVELGVADFFVDVLDSGRLGFGKPDRRIFAHAVATLGLPPAQVVHVGDSESADVVGAIEAGLWAIRFDGFNPDAARESSRAHERATNYAELRAVLGQVLRPRDMRLSPAT